MSKFRQQYPQIRLHITNYTSPEAIESVKKGIVDFSVVTIPNNEIQKNNAIMLKSIKELPICSNAYPKLLDREISIDELAEYPLISLSSATKTFWVYRDFFLKNGISFEPDIEAATADQILPMVQNNLGIGFVPEDFIDKNDNSINIIKLKENLPLKAICHIKGNTPLGAAAKKLENLILSGS